MWRNWLLLQHRFYLLLKESNLLWICWRFPQKLRNYSGQFGTHEIESETRFLSQTVSTGLWWCFARPDESDTACYRRVRPVLANCTWLSPMTPKSLGRPGRSGHPYFWFLFFFPLGFLNLLGWEPCCGAWVEVAGLEKTWCCPLFEELTTSLLTSDLAPVFFFFLGRGWGAIALCRLLLVRSSL